MVPYKVLDARVLVACVLDDRTPEETVMTDGQFNPCPARGEGLWFSWIRPPPWRAAAAPDHRDVSRSVANASTSWPAVFTTGLPSRSRHHSSSMRNRPSSAASGRS